MIGLKTYSDEAFYTSKSKHEETIAVAVRIRMKKLGRKHRPFFRICAVDIRAPRDGRVLEELGTYDPMIRETDARAELNHDRISYWLGVGAQMSDRVGVLFKKYGPEGTHLAAREAALAKLAGPKVLPDPGAPAYVAESPTEETAAEGTVAEESKGEAAETAETATETAQESAEQSKEGTAESESVESETEASETEQSAVAEKDAPNEEAPSEGDPAAAEEKSE